MDRMSPSQCRKHWNRSKVGKTNGIRSSVERSSDVEPFRTQPWLSFSSRLQEFINSSEQKAVFMSQKVWLSVEDFGSALSYFLIWTLPLAITILKTTHWILVFIFQDFRIEIHQALPSQFSLLVEFLIGKVPVKD